MKMGLEERQEGAKRTQLVEERVLPNGLIDPERIPIASAMNSAANPRRKVALPPERYRPYRSVASERVTPLQSEIDPTNDGPSTDDQHEEPCVNLNGRHHA